MASQRIAFESNGIVETFMAPLLLSSGYSALFILLVFYLMREVVQKDTPRDRIVRIAILALVAATWFIGPKVDGLEYEDAYIHLAAARFQSANPTMAQSGYYVTTCAAGSTNNCAATVTYGTQLIGLSTLLTLEHRLGVPFSIVSNVTSYVAAFLSLQILWTALRRRCDLSSSIAAVGLLLSTPAFYLFSGTSFAEPVYMFLFVLTSVIGIELLESKSLNPSNPEFVIFTLASFLMIAVKKEGILLVLILLSWSVWNSTRGNGTSFRRPAFVAFICAIVFIVSVLIFRIEDADIRHSADIGMNAFDLRFALALVPAMLSAAFDVSLFGPSWIVGSLAACVVVLRHDRTSTFLLLSIVAYFVLYSVHARHSAFAHGASVHPEEMSRYIYTLGPALALMCGIAIMSLKSRSEALHQFVTSSVGYSLSTLVAVTFLAFCSAALRHQRVDMAFDERVGRLAALKYIDKPTGARNVVVSPYSLALYARGQPDTDIVDRGVLERSASVRRYLSLRESEGASIFEQ